MTQPIIMTIFGITGDLSRKKLIPACYDLFCQRLDQPFDLIGFGRRPFSRDDFEQLLVESLPEKKPEHVQQFLAHCHYVQGNFDYPASFQAFTKTISGLDNSNSATKLFYLAVAPEFFGPISQSLAKAKLNNNARLIIEKPFGHNLASSQQLNQQLLEHFEEDQMYRIDHFLGKEAVQNILAFRFGNGMFEHLWNNQCIDHIQITVAESIGIEGRATYYDSIGAVRDMVQNHCLELLAHITMEEPANWTEKAIRDNRSAVLQQVKVEKWVTGQYDDYNAEPNVSPESQTETFVVLKLSLESSRWQNVPIYIRTGKRLATKQNTISVQFKTSDSKLFTSQPNILTFQIQPHHCIGLTFFVKTNGKRNDLLSQQMAYCVPPHQQTIGDYEQLLLDCLQGDQTFFIRHDEIEAAWRCLEPVLKDLLVKKPIIYETGSWGPDLADKLIQQDHRHWFSHQI